MIIAPRVIEKDGQLIVSFRDVPDNFDARAEIDRFVSNRQWPLHTHFWVHIGQGGDGINTGVLKAAEQFVVCDASEQYMTKETGPDRSMSSNVWTCRCKPASEMAIGASDSKPTAPQLQKRMKELTGKGFRPGTSREDMIAALADAEKAA